MKVKLDDLLEAFEFAGESHTHYLNRSTGQIHLIPEDVESYVDDEEFEEDDLPEREKESVHIYKEIITHPDKYIELPDPFYINMYSVMEKFVLSLTDVKVRNKIYYVMKGTGAFGRFRESIEESGLSGEWYRYKEQALRELAIVWCTENDVEYY